jgi:type II secretory pathway predicted ATPase ExeA
MYEKFFGLTDRPFDLAPDPRFLFLTEGHARAVANMKFALMNHDTFVILSGEIGIGKTTVLNTVLDELGGGYETARLTHTTLDNIELLQALLSEFGKPMYTRKRVQLLDTLRDIFLEKHRQRSHVVIIVDEAQKLSAEALEELRLLSCIDSHDRRIVTIVLTGSTELDDVLDSPKLVQLRQRVRLRQRLECLNEEETAAYIRHRLQLVGGDMDAIFEPGVVGEIHRLATGTPRLINTLCDTALMACCVDEVPMVTK